MAKKQSKPVLVKSGAKPRKTKPTQLSQDEKLVGKTIKKSGLTADELAEVTSKKGLLKLLGTKKINARKALIKLRYEEELEKLQESLQSGSYRPQGIRRKYIDKPGSREARPLGIPTVRDRVVQTALRMVLEPIFEETFADSSYGFRPGRGCKDALRAVMQKLQSGHYWVVDADIRSYFDRISHRKLMERIRERVADGRVLE